MCKEGWVLNDENGEPPVVDEWHGGEVHTCEMVFRGKVGKGDYHDNMDGDMFMKWVNERLVPTVQRKYPDKKVSSRAAPIPIISSISKPSNPTRRCTS